MPAAAKHNAALFPLAALHHRRLISPLTLGRYPTPVERLDSLSTPDTELWVKRDDLTHDVYGGNKVRKLEWLLAEACARGARRIVTVGAAGSHHVLATTYFGKRQGFDVEAVLVPQPRTEHVVEVLRAAIGLGLRAVPVGSWAGALFAILRLRMTNGRQQFITVGGSSVVGAMGYVAAARELAIQVRQGQMPEPDVCVVALGSGGTAAGLAAGFRAQGMKTRVVGVCVARPLWILRLRSLLLTRACERGAVKLSISNAKFNSYASAITGASLEIDTCFLGKGYGYPTAEGQEASRMARGVGLALDPTYTEKAFASVLRRLRTRAASKAGKGRRLVVLFWHTLSSAPMAPLLKVAPSEGQLDPKLRHLIGRPLLAGREGPLVGEET